VIDRKSELKVAQFISRHQAGPTVLGSFLNGRLEGFLDGTESLTPTLMLDKSISGSVAEAVAALHCLPFARDMPGHQSRSLWHTVTDWLAQARAARPHFAQWPAKLAVFDSLHLAALQRELAELRALLDSLDEPLVFCHNDLLSGNILHTPGSSPPAVTLIDFEYGALNFRAFDLANHFVECCGFDCDWAMFPDEDHQRAFIRTYLRAVDAFHAGQHAGDAGAAPASFSPFSPAGATDGEEGSPALEAAVECLRRRVLGFVLAAHLFWATWAVVMAISATIDFDYLGYAARRLRGYHYMKHRSLLALEPVLAARGAHPHLEALVSARFAQAASLPAPAPQPASLRAVVVGWGMAGRGLHAPLLAQAEGVTLAGVVLRDHDRPAADAAAAPALDALQLTLPAARQRHSPAFLERAAAAVQHLADLNAYAGASGLHIDGREVARAEADRCAADYSEPCAAAGLPEPEAIEWRARRQQEAALVAAEREVFAARVLRRGFAWDAQPLLPLGLDAPALAAAADALAQAQAPPAAALPASPLALAVSAGAAAPDGLSRAHPALHAALYADLAVPAADPAPRVYPSLEAALADPAVRLLVLATPPATHDDYTRRALAAGKHVVCDKPLVPTRAQAQALADLAYPAGGLPARAVFACFQNRRRDGDFVTAHRLLHRGRAPWQPEPLAAGAAPGLTSPVLGRVRWAELAFQKGETSKEWKLAPLEQGGGRLWDLGAHAVDQALLLFRPHAPVAVHAHVLRDVPGRPEVDSHCRLSITFADGSVAAVDCSPFRASPAPRLLLVGDRATLRWDGMDAQEAALLAGRAASQAIELSEPTTCDCATCRAATAALEAETEAAERLALPPCSAALARVVPRAGPPPALPAGGSDGVGLTPYRRGTAVYIESGRWAGFYTDFAAHCRGVDRAHALADAQTQLQGRAGPAAEAVARANPAALVPPSPVPPCETVAAVAVLEAALLSAREGRTVQLDL
jgi:ethanolamine kinase